MILVERKYYRLCCIRVINIVRANDLRHSIFPATFHPHSTATDRSRCEKIHAATSQNAAVSIHPQKTMPGLACQLWLKSALISGSSNPWTGITYFENAPPRNASSAGMPANVPAPIAANSGGMNVDSNSVSDAVSRQAVHSASTPNHIAPSLKPKRPSSQLAVKPKHKQNTPRTSAIPANKPNMYWRREIPFDRTANMRRERWSACMAELPKNTPNVTEYTASCRKIIRASSDPVCGSANTPNMAHPKTQSSRKNRGQRCSRVKFVAIKKIGLTRLPRPLD